MVIRTSWSGVRLTTHKSVQQFEKWRRVEHVNLIPLREMFTTKAFGDNCEYGGRRCERGGVREV